MDDHEHDELIMLYEQATEDIRTFQGRQTSVTYFTTLIYAALIALASTVQMYGPGWLQARLPLVAIVTMLTCLGWLACLQSATHRARGKVDRARETFSKAFQDASGEKRDGGWLEAWDTLLLLVIVVVIGAAIAVCVVGAILDFMIQV